MKIKTLIGILSVLTFSPSFAADNSSNPPQFGFEKQKQIDVVPDDMNSDPFFNSGDAVRPKVNPSYELSLEGGAFFPTYDKTTFNLYYAQKTVFGKVSVGRMFWWQNMLGLTFGVKGMYATNTGNEYIPDPSTPVDLYKHSFYTMSGEGFVGLRFRNYHFLYLQPGIFGSAGALQYQETATALDASQYSDYKITETNFIYSIGMFCDLNISAFAAQTEMDNSAYVSDVLLRASSTYTWNPPQSALAMTGYYISVGFVFLIK